MNDPIIFFDDLCVLCSRAVRIIHKNERKKQFYFSSLASDQFSKISALLPSQKPLPDSIILLYNGKIYMQSAAVLRIAMKLKFPYPLLVLGFIFPPFLRNGIYNWIARNRYQWFGRLDSCYLPEESLREKYLD
jgi:predicted DCC family thiol-disulfide oxidoreductase YuxK